MFKEYFMRYDAISALEDPIVKKILPRYVKVAEDELPSRFQIARHIVFEFRRDMEEKEMWDEHRKLMLRFYETMRMIDIGKLSLDDLEIPRFSLIDLKMMIVKEMMKSCELCEWKCGVDRWNKEKGRCGIEDKCLISSEFIHMGEESFYVPSHTIFFWSCNMNCVFCQNFTISNRIEPGISTSPKTLAKIIEERRVEGCRNCNLVGGEPTMHLFWILGALKECRLSTPILWNSNMFMSEKTMEVLNGIVDVYLTDFKFGPGKCSEVLTKVRGYWDVVTRNHLIASSQTELTVRHLILPDHVKCCSHPIIEWIANNIKEKCIFNPMDQYYPCYLAKNYPGINRRISPEEYNKVLNKAKECSLNIKD